MISLAILIILALIALKFGTAILKWTLQLGMAFVFVVGLLYLIRVWL